LRNSGKKKPQSMNRQGGQGTLTRGKKDCLPTVRKKHGVSALGKACRHLILEKKKKEEKKGKKKKEKDASSRAREGKGRHHICRRKMGRAFHEGGKGHRRIRKKKRGGKGEQVLRREVKKKEIQTKKGGSPPFSGGKKGQRGKERTPHGTKKSFAT